MEAQIKENNMKKWVNWTMMMMEVLELIYDLLVSGQKSSGCNFLKNGTDTKLSRKRERQKQPRWEIYLKDKRYKIKR